MYEKDGKDAGKPLKTSLVIVVSDGFFSSPEHNKEGSNNNVHVNCPTIFFTIFPCSHCRNVGHKFVPSP